MESFRERKKERLAFLRDMVDVSNNKGFRKWLREEIDRHQTKPGKEGEMLLQIGVRDGLQLVEKKLESSLLEAKEILRHE